MDIFACPVCMDSFVDPQILPGCGHTFCKACIQQLESSSSRGRCPTCRQQFRPTEIRPNFALQSMMTAQPAPTVPHAPPPTSSTSLPKGQLVRAVDSTNQIALRKNLEKAGLPYRLADSIAQEDQRIGLRIFVLDNSGSMCTCDGKVFEVDEEEEIIFPIGCSRWDEVKRMALDQARWNLQLGIPCEFMLLNAGPPPAREGVDFVRLDPNQPQQGLASLTNMLERTWPHGATPLVERIQQIYSRIKTQHKDLAAAGQHVMLIIATDGLPTSASLSSDQVRRMLVQQLRQIMIELPVYVVVRLCTDESDVVDFYNEIENDVELPMDVLDDMAGEAREVYNQGNGWFAYTKQLHTIREGGTFLKLLDLIDERRLTQTECALLSQLILLPEGQDPLPRQVEAFCDEIEEVADDAYLVYDARTMGLAAPVDGERLRSAMIGFWGPVASIFATMVAVCRGRREYLPRQSMLGA